MRKKTLILPIAIAALSLLLIAGAWTIRLLGTESPYEYGVSDALGETASWLGVLNGVVILVIFLTARQRARRAAAELEPGDDSES
jgi:hypothetical protein